jgi:cadmium resistance transport/sequestration family protein
MSWLIKAITTGALSFAATNIDDLFVLALFFGQTSKLRERMSVVVGQYLGFAALVAVSLLGYFARLVVPRAWIGLLGLLPVAIGVKKLLEVKKTKDEDAKQLSASSVFAVAMVTFANGGDNIGIYTPLFAASDSGALIVMLLVFFLLLALWCLVGYYLGSHPVVSKILDRYGHLIVPFVLIGLGLYIMYESDTLRLVR